jgi:hypothetical protein
MAVMWVVASGMAHRMRADEPFTGLFGHVMSSLGSGAAPTFQLMFNGVRRFHFRSRPELREPAAPRLSFGQDKQAIRQQSTKASYLSASFS